MLLLARNIIIGEMKISFCNKAFHHYTHQNNGGGRWNKEMQSPCGLKRCYIMAPMADAIACQRGDARINNDKFHYFLEI